MTSASLRAALAAAVCAALVGGLLLLFTSGGAGAGGASPGTLRPVVVQTAEGTLEGAGGHGVEGPATFRATYAHPTRPGDLLVAAVIDGVVSSGMTQPSWRPAGWQLGKDEIGGELATDGGGAPDTGGLQATILYWPDNPGGVTSVDFGSVPKGTQAAVTGYVAELSGVPATLRVVATGSSTSGPTSATFTDQSTVSIHETPSTLPALVLAAFTNGGTTPSGERFRHSAGWRVLGEDANRDGIDQPILFDERVWSADAPPSEWMSYQEVIDSCAAMVALA